MLNVIPRQIQVIQTPKTPEKVIKNVFDYTNETGTKVIQYLHQCGEKYKEADRILFIHNQPTIVAYEAELSLVEGIRQREANQISAEALKAILDHYIKTHSPDADISPDKWTREDVPLYYVRLFHNGDFLEAYTANAIQAQIITAMWQTVNPETTAKIIRL